MNLSKSMIEKGTMSIVVTALFVIGVHTLACVWIYLGKRTSCSWLFHDGCASIYSGVKTIDVTNRKSVLVASYYFIVTTLTTVGYGDIAGVTEPEYIFQMIIEFLGIFLISILMGTINGIVEQEPTLQDIVDERIDDLEVWLLILDQSRDNYLPKNLYNSIKLFVEKSFTFDINMIRKNQKFYEQLKPKTR